MSLDSFIDERLEKACKKCGDPECGTCKTCKQPIVSGITCVGCAKDGKELSGWWWNDVNHTW